MRAAGCNYPAAHKHPFHPCLLYSSIADFPPLDPIQYTLFIAFILKIVNPRGSLGYNDPEHFRENRASAFKKVKRVWKESRKRSKIKVKGQNIFNQIKDLASYYGHRITILLYTQKGDNGEESARKILLEI